MKLGKEIDIMNSTRRFNFFKRKEVNNSIHALADGELIELASINDPVFSTGMMGEGVAFRYVGEKVTICSPCDGILATLFPTGHAFGLVLENGVEIIVHIGIDTINEAGRGFTVQNVKQGMLVKQGQPIVTVDLQELSKRYDMSTMLIITNANGNSYKFKKAQMVKKDDCITM